MSPRSLRRHSPEGFSLVELLTVVAIIIVLVTLARTAITGSQQGLTLTSAGAAIKSELTVARETALGRRVPVEVRFYMRNTDNTNIYCGIQSFSLTANASTGNATWSPNSKPYWLPGGLMINTDTEYTSLFSANAATNASAPPALPSSVTKALAFQFLPNGYTSMTVTSSPFLTIQRVNSPAKPENYYTIQIDPINGKIRSFRP